MCMNPGDEVAGRYRLEELVGDLAHPDAELAERAVDA
jgi:hypothetical protein